MEPPSVPKMRPVTGKNVRAAATTFLILMVLALLPISLSASGPAFGNVTASRPAFNSLTGQVTIYYTWSGPTNGSMAVAIVDAGGRVVKAMDVSPQDAGRHYIAWDGKDGNDSPTSEGAYRVWLLYAPNGGLILSYLKPFVLPEGIENASVNVTVDNTPPSTYVTLSGEQGDYGVYTTVVEARLNAVDSLSGINVTEYSLDYAPWARYGHAIIMGYGEHTLSYRSVDGAGNTEAARTVQVTVSTDPASRGTGGPRVIYTMPMDGDYSVPVDSVVCAWFDRDMDGRTVNASTFRLKDVNGAYMSGIVDYRDIAIFVPDIPLTPYVKYTAVICNMADTDDRQMDSGYTWSFIAGDALASWDLPDEGDGGLANATMNYSNTSFGGQENLTAIDNLTVRANNIWADHTSLKIPPVPLVAAEENESSATPSPIVQQPSNPFQGAYSTFALILVFFMTSYWLVRRKK